MLGKLIGKLTGGEHERIIAAYVEGHDLRRSPPEFRKTAVGKEIHDWPPAEQIALLHHVFDAIGPAVERYAEIANELDAAYERDDDSGRRERLQSEWSTVFDNQSALRLLAVRCSNWACR